MKKTVVLFLIFLFSGKGYSQLCGQSILTFNIYTLNGEEIDEFEYEIFAVSEELLREKFYKKTINEVNIDNPQYILYSKIQSSGFIIMKHFVDEIIEPQDEQLNERLKKYLDLSRIPQKGTLKSTLLFITIEGNDFPIILKISKGEKSIYILGNYFGNCRREASLIWNGGYGKLD